MNQPVDLLRAIRAGRLSDVIAALDAGAQVDLLDGRGTPGLPLAMACFKGYAEIVRELAIRGAMVNFPDNSASNSPLAIAIKGGKTEVVKVLIEYGAEVPAGFETGLNDQELMVARWKAQHFGARKTAEGLPERDFDVIEEIEMVRCYGTDTTVLDADMRRTVQELSHKK